jgi:signal transduction histidine kinase
MDEIIVQPPHAEEPRPLKYSMHLRWNLLAISGCTIIASLLSFLPGFPFHVGFCAVTLASSVMHLAAFIWFSKVSRNRAVLEAMVLINLALLGFVIHFTGGIMSPFVFFYFWVLASAIIYGIEDRYSTWFAIVTYSALILSEAYGFLDPWGISSRDVYASKPVTIILVAAIVVFIMMTRYVTGLVLYNLRASLERENAEKEGLLKKFSELNASAQIGVLAHRIAHDLRGPISFISGYIQLEMLKEKTAEDREALRDLGTVVANMAEALRGITRFGKADAAAIERLELADFLRTLLVIVAFSPQAKGIKFRRKYPDSLAAHVNASKSDLQQAYFNLLKNAVEAVRDNAGEKVIELSLRLDGKELEVTVADNGPGIPEELLKNIFRRSITTKKDGTGVGLTITRDLLTRNNGTIELRNRPEGGLCVATLLPLAPPL